MLMAGNPTYNTHNVIAVIHVKGMWNREVFISGNNKNLIESKLILQLHTLYYMYILIFFLIWNIRHLQSILTYEGISDSIKIYWVHFSTWNFMPYF